MVSYGGMPYGRRSDKPMAGRSRKGYIRFWVAKCMHSCLTSWCISTEEQRYLNRSPGRGAPHIAVHCRCAREDGYSLFPSAPG